MVVQAQEASKLKPKWLQVYTCRKHDHPHWVWSPQTPIPHSLYCGPTLSSYFNAGKKVTAPYRERETYNNRDRGSLHQEVVLWQEKKESYNEREACDKRGPDNKWEPYEKIAHDKRRSYEEGERHDKAENFDKQASDEAKIPQQS